MKTGLILVVIAIIVAAASYVVLHNRAVVTPQPTVSATPTPVLLPTSSSHVPTPRPTISVSVAPTHTASPAPSTTPVPTPASSSTPTPSATPTPTPSPSATLTPAPGHQAYTVTIGMVAGDNVQFNPSTLTVYQGDVVTFINNDNFSQNVTANGNQFKSGTLQPGASYQLQTNTLLPGTYQYKSTLHPTVQGTLIVQQYYSGY